MKEKYNRHDARARRVLEQQSGKEGKFRRSPHEREQEAAQAKINRMREEKEMEIQSLVNKIAHWTSPKIYAGNVSRPWAEILLGVSQKLKLTEVDQQDIVEDLYYVHNPDRSNFTFTASFIVDEAKTTSVSDDMMRIRQEIMNHWTRIQENRKSVDEFHSVLEAL